MRRILFLSICVALSGGIAHAHEIGCKTCNPVQNEPSYFVMPSAFKAFFGGWFAMGILECKNTIAEKAPV